MNKAEVDALWDEYERKHLVPQAYAKLDHYLRNNLDDVDYAEYSQALDVVLSASEAPAPGLSEILRSLDEAYSNLDLGDYARGFGACIDKLNALTRASAATVAEPKDWTADECVATGQTCTYGPHGRHGETQCKYCGAKPAAQQQLDSK